MTKRFFLMGMVAVLCNLSLMAASVVISEQQGWFESAFVTWQKTADMKYNVYVSPASADSWTKLDDELVREYPDYGRADAFGLAAGNYKFKVVPVSNDSEVTADAVVTESVEVRSHDRSGFAHVGMSDGIGAYRNDGTLKQNARVLYVWAGNAKTVTLDVKTDSKGGTTTGKGLQDIITLLQKGYENRPLAIRIVGTIKASDMDRFDSSEEGLQIKGKNNYNDMPVTLEGVGNDAAIWGFGILCRNCKGTEFRNFAVILCKDDALSIDTNNSNVWVHNMDFFYGQTGKDADQAKGDGTVDIKGLSKNITVSYNHFFDNGKSSLGGMKSETTDCWMTYHHNWFDHSDSRHPRIRTAFYHIYNNYFDGISKYGVGVTMGGSAFVENNDFRNTKYPMLISGQGTDAEGDGTFSNESGGVIKAYNNTITGARKVQYYTEGQTDGKWDAVLVTERSAAVNAKALSGGSAYNNAADNAARTTYIENRMDAADKVRDVVKSHYGAGRMQQGDFQWTFDNATQDANYDIINELKTALQNYKSSLVGFFGKNINNDDTTNPTDGGDGQDTDPATQPSTTGEFTYFPNGKKDYNTFFSITGNTSKDYGTTTYTRNGETYDCTHTLKIESSTVITFTPAKDGTLKIAMSPDGAANLKINGNTVAGNGNIISYDVKAGTEYSITKKDKAYVFYLELSYHATAIPTLQAALPRADGYKLNGLRAKASANGLYIIGGKKVVIK